MKNQIRILSVILFAFFFVGCVAVPSTKIVGDLHSGKFSYKSPTDKAIGFLKISATTNGTVSVELRNVSSTNNPDVITSSAQGQVDIIRATGEVVGNAAAAAAKAAAK